MAQRSHEGPMDFEYQNGTGPIDARSPFAQISLNQQRSMSNGTGTSASGKKRGFFGSFNSASKPTPFASAVRAANFATPRKFDLDPASSGGETPQSPDRTGVDSDATPDNVNTINFRASPVKFDQSAGMPTFTAGGHDVQETALPSPSKRPARRESWLSKGWEFFNSPGRSSHVTRAGQNDSMLRKVKKKQRADRPHRQLARLRDNDDDDDSGSGSDTNDDRRMVSPRKTSRSKRDLTALGAAQSAPDDRTGYIAHISSFFEFLAKHPTLPTILSWYAQLTLNIFVFTGIMWVLWSFWSTIRSDVDKKSSEAIAELMAEMAVCAKQWSDNRCGPETRVPAMEVVCNNWEKCMKRDVASVGRAKVSAHTFAEIFNSFLEPISYKAMIFSLLLVFGCVALSNLPFSMFRDKAAAAAAASATGANAGLGGPNAQPAAQQNHHHYYPPPTPGGGRRQISGGPMDAHGNMQTWTPHAGGMVDYEYAANEQLHAATATGTAARQTIEPDPAGGAAAGNRRYGRIEGRGSPVKQLHFR